MTAQPRSLTASVPVYPRRREREREALPSTGRPALEQSSPTRIFTRGQLTTKTKIRGMVLVLFLSLLYFYNQVPAAPRLFKTSCAWRVLLQLLVVVPV